MGADWWVVACRQPKFRLAGVSGRVLKGVAYLALGIVMGTGHKYGCWLGFGSEVFNSASLRFSLVDREGSIYSAMEAVSVVRS